MPKYLVRRTEYYRGVLDLPYESLEAFEKAIEQGTAPDSVYDDLCYDGVDVEPEGVDED